jgi:acetyl esterase/lipase
MKELRRREFLSLGGALLAAQAAAQPPSASASTPRPPASLPGAWLAAATIPLWPDDPPGRGSFAPQPVPEGMSPVFVHNVFRPDIRVFRPARPDGRALLVVPGGSYSFVSIANEGLDVASRMTRHGVTVFVLTYRLPGNGWSRRSDVPLQDAQRAMRVIRANASRFAIDAAGLAVLGFSAGGHLAATLATRHAEQTYARVDSIDDHSARPLAAGLVYPVITMETPVTHELSRKQLLGETPGVADIERRSAERHVDPSTPPAFVVHAFDDLAVPVENSLRYVNAMREAKRPVEAHLLQEGGHAFGVGLSRTPSEVWPSSFLAWLDRAWGQRPVI